MASAHPSHEMITALYELAAVKPNNKSFVDGDTELSIEEFIERASSYGMLFSTEDRVLVTCASPLEALLYFFGACMKGAIPFLGDPTWSAADSAQIAKRYGIDVMVGANIERLNADTPKPPIADATAFVRFTSGSTGYPRALMYSATAAHNAATNFARAAKYDASTKIVCFSHPCNGLAFNTSVLSSVLSGASTHFFGGQLLPSSIATAIQQSSANVMIGFPLVYQLALSRTDRLASTCGALRLCISSAARLAPSLHQSWLSATGVPIGDYYGLAETGPVTFNPGSYAGQGVAMDNCSVRAEHSFTDEPSRISVKTNSMAIGFIPDGGPTLSKDIADGWFTTKDRGTVIDNSLLMLSGRMDRIVSISGLKVDLDSLEAKSKSIIGISDAYATTEDADGRTLIALHLESAQTDRQFVRSELSKTLLPHEYPEKIFVSKKLSRSISGKIRKQQN